MQPLAQGPVRTHVARADHPLLQVRLRATYPGILKTPQYMRCSLMLVRAATVLVGHEHARAEPPATQHPPPPAAPWSTLRQLMSRLWAKVESEATAFVTGKTGA